MTTTDYTNTNTDQTTTADTTGSNGFRSITDWDLKRSTEDKWLGGVASMIAKNLNVDPLFVRGAIAIGAWVTGWVFALYVLAWLLLPSTTNPVAPLQGFLSRFNRPAPAAPQAPAPAAEQPAPPVDVTVG